MVVFGRLEIFPPFFFWSVGRLGIGFLGWFVYIFIFIVIKINIWTVLVWFWYGFGVVFGWVDVRILFL